MARLRVLEVNKAYYPHVGGIESIVRQYSEELGTAHPDVKVRTLVCRDGFGAPMSEQLSGVSLRRSGSLGTYFSCPLSLSFLRDFRKMAANSDVVHIHVPFPLADLALLLSGFKGTVAVSWHSDIVKQKKLLKLYAPLLRSLLRRADIIFVATKGHIKGSDWLRPYARKCRVLPYGVNVGDYLTIPEKPLLTGKCTNKDSVKIFFTGRLVYYKGVDVLLKAFRAANLRNAELFIAGSGELEDSLRQYARRSGIGDKVHFLGFLDDDDLKQAYADCDIFVLPSVEKSEAFGIVQLEAMASGKPVINTRLPSGVPYVSIHGRTGLTVPPKDYRILAAAMRTLAADEAKRKKYGEAARKRAAECFDEKTIIDRLYKYLSSGR